MNREQAVSYVAGVWQIGLRREPRSAESDPWVNALVEGRLTADRLVDAVLECDEYKARVGVRPNFPIGHFYSSIVDPRTVKDYVHRERKQQPTEIPGISFDFPAMRDFWLKNLDFIKTTPFIDTPDPQGNRYCYLGGPFPYADAITLRTMIHHLQPRRIIEIGSGYSTACMLDSAEHMGLTNLQITCVEPNAERLRSVLRAADSKIVNIIEDLVQNVPPSAVDELEPNDILFIDSSHVLKTGSDVHYEIFHLLPRLKKGVVVHFHDIMYPFEYPDEWIEQNYSWNECYFLRSFLMYNQQFKIKFWNPLFARRYLAEIRDEFPLFLRNTGGSIWIERV